MIAFSGRSVFGTPIAVAPLYLPWRLGDSCQWSISNSLRLAAFQYSGRGETTSNTVVRFLGHFSGP